MKKRVSLLVLTFTLLLSGMNVQAAEKNTLSNLGKYVSFFVNEVTGKKQDDSLSALISSAEELMQDVKPEEVTKLIDFVEKQIQNGKWDNEEGIEEAIALGEQEFNVKLTEKQKKQILEIVESIKKLGISPEYILQQAEKIYEKYGNGLKEEVQNAGKEVVEQAKNKIQEEVKKSLVDYFSDMVQSVKSFFKGIFNR